MDQLQYLALNHEYRDATRRSANQGQSRATSASSIHTAHLMPLTAVCEAIEVQGNDTTRDRHALMTDDGLPDQSAGSEELSHPVIFDGLGGCFEDLAIDDVGDHINLYQFAREAENHLVSSSAPALERKEELKNRTAWMSAHLEDIFRPAGVEKLTGHALRALESISSTQGYHRDLSNWCGNGNLYRSHSLGNSMDSWLLVPRQDKSGGTDRTSSIYDMVYDADLSNRTAQDVIGAGMRFQDMIQPLVLRIDDDLQTEQQGLSPVTSTKDQPIENKNSIYDMVSNIDLSNCTAQDVMRAGLKFQDVLQRPVLKIDDDLQAEQQRLSPATSTKDQPIESKASENANQTPLVDYREPVDPPNHDVEGSHDRSEMWNRLKTSMKTALCTKGFMVLTQAIQNGGSQQTVSSPRNMGTSSDDQHTAQQNIKSNRKRKGKQRAAGDGGNDDGDDGNSSDSGDDKKYASLKKPRIAQPQKQFACPFFKNNPAKYATRRTCLGPGWRTVHRVKEHVYRCHALPDNRCPRCHAVFETDQLLANHLKMQIQCPISAEVMGDQINKDTVQKLRSKAKSAGTSEVAKWATMYRIIFPNDETVPSAYYECDDVQNAQLDNFCKQVQKPLIEELSAALSLCGAPANIHSLLPKLVGSVVAGVCSRLGPSNGPRVGSPTRIDTSAIDPGQSSQGKLPENHLSVIPTAIDQQDAENAELVDTGQFLSTDFDNLDWVFDFIEWDLASSMPMYTGNRNLGDKLSDSGYVSTDRP